MRRARLEPQDLDDAGVLVVAGVLELEERRED
jgi:hypothetical protein